jgi:hypothetical protein
MAMKQQGKKVYRSMQGKTVDMDLLRKRNELTPAVGNARVNARGDELGPGGKIIKKREDVVKEYYEGNPSSVVDEEPVRQKQTSDAQSSIVDEEPNRKKSRAQQKVESSQDEWVEDADGNFVKKGE